MQCVYGTSLDERPDHLARLAALALDSRWKYRFRLINIGHVPGRPLTPVFSGIIPASKLDAAVSDSLLSKSTERVLFGVSRSRQSELDAARFSIELGRGTPLDGAFPYTARAHWFVPDDADREAATRAWLDLQHEILRLLGAAHGIVVASIDFDALGIELWLSNIDRNGVPVHPDPAEISAYAVQRHKLGDEYIRAPRWGTYLKPAHVAAVGGRDKIVDVVKPPVVRDVGELLYVQLSEHVADALAPETEARRRVFADLLAPITMPRLESR
jgi:hypothetical protein